MLRLTGFGHTTSESQPTEIAQRISKRTLKRDLLDVLDACAPRPNAPFRIAIEESEAWPLGDGSAVKAAYPNAKDAVLDDYEQDGICGTWELLADAMRPGGAGQLGKAGWPAPGQARCDWAARIAPRMNPAGNRSPSFRAFRDGVRRLAERNGRVEKKSA